MPFALYTDPGNRVYHALGMTRRSTDPGPEHERGAYVRHGTLGGIAMVVRNALRVGMPVWERGGDQRQLGGEFVLGGRREGSTDGLSRREIIARATEERLRKQREARDYGDGSL